MIIQAVTLNTSEPDEKSIVLQTSKGSNIENNQIYGFTKNELDQIRDTEKKYHSILETRGEASNIYNCHA